MLLVLLTGGHWAMLQTAAWVRMTLDFSQMDGFRVAIRKTLDGKHPCPLCLFISKQKKSDEKKHLQQIQTRLDLFLVTQPFVLYPPPFPPAFSALASASSWIDNPPFPPPRSSLA